ncbi:hypothetical protein [uncultured Algimonas sp.]|uniref:hypothetical protein n=1 Tax=uncultured Algimonas sp. TaxID=1547920 RepID=UPI002636A546|nr:hypothetical protein [uncultured Algimonas sp.]
MPDAVERSLAPDVQLRAVRPLHRQEHDALINMEAAGEQTPHRERGEEEQNG